MERQFFSLKSKRYAKVKSGRQQQITKIVQLDFK